MADVILPVLDEAPALPWVPRAHAGGLPPDRRRHGSSDGSGALARSLGAVVVSESRRGFGAACHAGLVAATVSFEDGMRAFATDPLAESLAGVPAD